MLEQIKSFFNTNILPVQPAETGIRSPNTAKTSTSAPNIETAACAILVEIASIDGEFTDQERDIIVGILKNKFSLTDDDARQLIELSLQELSDSIDIWQFTNRINENFSREQKINLIESIWKVIYSDSYLEKHEDYLIHKLQGLLRLTHNDLITAKLKIKNDRNFSPI